jgi:hypothetical protein
MGLLPRKSLLPDFVAKIENQTSDTQFSNIKILKSQTEITVCIYNQLLNQIKYGFICNHNSTWQISSPILAGLLVCLRYKVYACIYVKIKTRI